MSPDDLSRRMFLQSTGALAGSSYLRMLAPGLAAITQAACTARDEQAPFTTLGADEARDLAAIAARIIPTTDTPGATEAGVVYFFDRAFSEELNSQLGALRSGLADFNSALQAEHGESIRLDELEEDAQDEFLKTQESTSLFQLIRVETIIGFFAMEKYGGNRDKVGWDLVGFVGDQGPWQYPFGYYDAEVHGEKSDG